MTTTKRFSRLSQHLGLLLTCGSLVVGSSAWLACSSAPANSDDSTGDDTSDDTSGDSGRKDSGKGKDGSPTSTGDDSSDDSTQGDDSGPSENDGGTTEGGKPSACPANDTTQKTFMNLKVAAGTPLDRSHGGTPPAAADAGVTLTPGWNYYPIAGAVCRDGSEFGVYAHFTSSPKLYIYLEGGGACDASHFCTHNPASMHEVFPGGEATQGQSIGGSLATQQGLQQPYATGIFDTGNADNPLKDWNGIYVPYCTGDVHFGTLDDKDINDDPLVAFPHQHFVGYKNMQKSIARIVPTFPAVNQVLLTGASAGALGAALNYGMVQDSFTTKVPVFLLDDSGPPSDEKALWPACLQKIWRETWGLKDSLPSDCAECNQADGTGLNKIIEYWHHKYPAARVGLISTMEDQVIRLFYGQGNSNCSTLDANTLTLSGGGVTAADYTSNLNSVLNQYKCTNAVATYYIGKSSNYSDDTLHQHIFRGAEYYKGLTTDGKTTLAQFIGDFVAGKLDNVGP